MYENFTGEGLCSNSDVLKNELLTHLSNAIVVKEHKLRYQKEQFDRLLIAADYWPLKNRKLSIEEWCVEYARLIELLISASHNNKCPKI